MVSADLKPIAAGRGLPLSELLAGELSHLPPGVALGIVDAAAVLLAKAHGFGNWHGGLGIDAIWISVGGDVGIDWFPGRAPLHKSRAPEVRRGEQPTVAADIYGLGAVAFELLTGMSLSRAWAKAPCLELHKAGSVAAFSSPVAPEVDGAISAALARDPFDRPRSIEALSNAVRPFATAELRSALQSMLADPFFVPAIRELPITCERAQQSPPPPPSLDFAPAADDAVPAAAAKPAALLLELEPIAAPVFGPPARHDSPRPLLRVMGITSAVAVCAIAAAVFFSPGQLEPAADRAALALAPPRLPPPAPPAFPIVPEAVASPTLASMADSPPHPSARQVKPGRHATKGARRGARAHR